MKTVLKEIGIQLDQNQFPVVYNGGIVKLSKADVDLSTMGEESHNERERQQETQIKPWERPQRLQWKAFKPWAASETAQIVSTELRDHYEAHLDEVRNAYPATKIWHQEKGMWLLTESSIISGLGKKATFLIAIPYSPLLVPRSWAFWTTKISNNWIGPRHTNFPDGSICAFEPKDKTWKIGDSITALIDLYTLWALRHLHLKALGRWPGYQSVHTPHERLSELKDAEFCGCENSNRLYSECCKPSDLQMDQMPDSNNFWQLMTGQKARKPPSCIVRFAWKREKPPLIENVLL